MARSTALSEFQLRALDAMGIQLWVPRRDLPMAGDVLWPMSRREANERADHPQRAVGTGDASAPKSSPVQAESGEPAAVHEPSVPAPAIKFQSLSLKGHHCHVLIDDTTYSELAFWRDLLGSLHGFRQSISVRERRFDWPLPGLEDASADAAQKALRGYLNQDRFVCVRGDAIANVLFGAGNWQSFPEKHRMAEAEIWVFGSDLGLKDVQTRRSIWKSIEGLETLS